MNLLIAVTTRILHNKSSSPISIRPDNWRAPVDTDPIETMLPFCRLTSVAPQSSLQNHYLFNSLNPGKFMTTTFTAYFAQATRRTVFLSPSLLSRSRHSPAEVEWGGSTHNPTRSGHGRWALAMLWLLWLGWSTNAIAQARTGVTVAGVSSKSGQGPDQLDTPQGVFVDGVVMNLPGFNELNK